MKNYITLILILLLCNNALTAQWKKITIDSVSQTINFSSLTFVSDKIGFIAGCDELSAWSTGVMLKTTDGGTTWSSLSHPVGNCSSPIFFIDKNTGYNGGQSFMKTNDGGKTWLTPDNSLPGVITPQTVYFISDSVGFINEGQSYISKTIDGGKIFKQVPFNSSSSISSIFFISPLQGFAVGYNKPLLLKTVDGGNTWDTLSTKYSLLSIFFPSEKIGYAVGHGGIIIKTTNGGNNWFPLYPQVTATRTFRSVFCPTNNTCFVVGDSGILIKTNDGGINWLSDSLPITSNLNIVTCTKNGTCYAVGDSGVLVKLANSAVKVLEPANKKKDNFLIYPNPSSSQITIEYTLINTYDKVFIEITDLEGKIISSTRLPQMYGPNTITLDNNNLKSGMYLCNIYGNGKIINTKKVLLSFY